MTCRHCKNLELRDTYCHVMGEPLYNLGIDIDDWHCCNYEDKIGVLNGRANNNIKKD